MRREPGEAIVRREVWRGEPKVAWGGFVVEDSPELLTLYMPEGPEREFRGWYVSLQEPFRRTALGFDTRDLKLDLVVDLDGSWHYKDEEKLAGWIERGRWTEDEVVAIRREGERIAAELDCGSRWWSEDRAEWRPDPSWRAPSLSARLS